MLAPDSEAHEPGRNPAKDREPVKQAQGERHLVEHRLADDERRKHPIVDELLAPLDDAGWK
jgi:hypothetical protein